MEDILVLALYILAAAGVSLVVRFYDYPKTEFVFGEVFKAFVGSLIAVAFTVWFMGDADIFKPEMFAIVAGAGVGGMSVVRGILDRFKPAE